MTERDRAAEAAAAVATAVQSLHRFVDELADDLRRMSDESLAEAKATCDERSRSAQAEGDWDTAVWAARWAVLAASLDVARVVARLG